MMMADKMVKRSSLVGTRKKLSDITNLQSPSKQNQNNPASVDGTHTKNYIEQLLKENAALLKLVQEKDQVIESTGLEMHKLRVILQKTQLQNWNLAQSNSQMLVELNVCKDKLLAVRHELACKEALFKTKIVELEEKAKMQHQNDRLQEKAEALCETKELQERETKPNSKAVDQLLQDNFNTESKMNCNKKRCSSRSRSMGSVTSKQAADKEMAENKRRCLRRQSVRLMQKQEPNDLFEIDVTKFPIRHQSMEESESKSCPDTPKVGPQQSLKTSESGSSSLGRPLRRAAEKVQSYKEPSLCQKMRRPE